jgi:hypothetical protein
MNIRNFLTGAAVAAVLAASGSANAQLLGGGATGSLGGSLTGGLGNVGATAGGTLNGSLRGSTDALGRVRDAGSRETGRAERAATAARGQVESVTADASATGEANSTLDMAGDAAVQDEKPAKPRRARREARRNAETVEPATRPAKPRPRAQAGGNAKADGDLGVSGDGQASGQADASVDANASIEK